MLHTLDRVLTLFEEIVITFGLATATLLLFTNVVLRYQFDTGLPWALEAVQYLFAWVVLIGSAHGIRAGIHLGINVLTCKFSEPVQRWLALIAISICFAFVVPVLLLSIEYIYQVWSWGDLSLDLQIPQWIPYLAIPVGLLLMTIRLMQVAWQIWHGERLTVGRSEAEEAMEQ
ncbi:MAG TPA: TRAP transporter small permease [Gammaproteobacteria bacterium]|nr:TRAP transporter small permease [Gammaproteobacteria bacterium]